MVVVRPPGRAFRRPRFPAVPRAVSGTGGQGRMRRVPGSVVPRSASQTSAGRLPRPRAGAVAPRGARKIARAEGRVDRP